MNEMKQLSDNIFATSHDEFSELFDILIEGRAGIKGFRPAIIFEGGALRGVLSCGYGVALNETSLNPDSFSLYGSSSGALNSIYFACRQLRDGLSIYADNATDKSCLNLWNFPNILNVDWLVDEWIFGKKAFDYKKIQKFPNKILISLTNLSDGEVFFFNAQGAKYDDLRKAMKATSYAPLLSNGYQVIDGNKYGDGAIGCAIPYDRAVRDGCTHIICLLTRPNGYRKGGKGSFTRFIRSLRLAHHTQEYRKAYAESERSYNRLLDKLYGSAPLPVPTMVICPNGSGQTPGNIESDPIKIREFGEQAYQLAKHQLTTLFPKISA